MPLLHPVPLQTVPVHVFAPHPVPEQSSIQLAPAGHVTVSFWHELLPLQSSVHVPFAHRIASLGGECAGLHALLPVQSIAHDAASEQSMPFWHVLSPQLI